MSHKPGPGSPKTIPEATTLIHDAIAACDFDVAEKIEMELKDMKTLSEEMMSFASAAHGEW
jgi:hypothetical protein